MPSTTTTVEPTTESTDTPMFTADEVHSQLADLRSQLESRIEWLDNRLADVDSLIRERNEAKGALAIILRVIDPEALPKRKRRTRAEIEAANAAEAPTNA